MLTATKNKIIVSVSDARVSVDTSDIIATYSLGSCIGVCLYDPVAIVGGMLHYQLPDSSLNQTRAQDNPFMFANTGIKMLLTKMSSLGATKNNMIVTIAGGAAISMAPKGFDIGKRNHLAIRKLMWKIGIPIKKEDVGGKNPRTLFMDIETGTVTIKTSSADN